MTPAQIANSQRERPVLVSHWRFCVEAGFEVPPGVYFESPRATAAQLVADGFAEYVDEIPAGWDTTNPEHLRLPGSLFDSRRDTDEDGVDRSARKPIDPLSLIFPALLGATLVLAAAKGVGVLTCSWWLALAPLWLALALFVGLLAALGVCYVMTERRRRWAAGAALAPPQHANCRCSSGKVST